MRNKRPERPRHGRSRADRRRRGRYIGWVVLGTPALAFLIYQVDRSGPLETVDGMVVETRSYTHNAGDRQGPHTHVEAVLEYEGHRHTVRPGDRFRQLDPVQVEVRRGRLTGYPYFVQAGRR